MSIIYKPVLIESAEQAETLPEGTIMFLPAGPYVWTARDPGGEFLDHYGRPWHFENTQDDEPFTALVPIEAEEEHGAGGRRHGRGLPPHPPPRHPLGGSVSIRQYDHLPPLTAARLAWA